MKTPLKILIPVLGLSFGFAGNIQAQNSITNINPTIKEVIKTHKHTKKFSIDNKDVYNLPIPAIQGDTLYFSLMVNKKDDSIDELYYHYENFSKNYKLIMKDKNLDGVLDFVSVNGEGGSEALLLTNYDIENLEKEKKEKLYSSMNSFIGLLYYDYYKSLK